MSVPMYSASFSVSTFSLPKCRPALRWALSALAVSLLSACGSFNGSSLMTSITPYKAEVVQGNFVSKEQVDALRPGMSRTQVREILGSPLLTSVFHGDRWDYVFTIRRQGVDAQARKLAVFFKGDDLEKFEGDTMPTEAEFIATIDTQRKFGKVPELEASEEQLAKSQGSSSAQPSAPTVSKTPAAPVTYPPLEPIAR
jgi:outer membrane protein assembly factor BamE